MQALKQFWQTLERTPGLAAPAVEWRDALGPDWGWGQSLLRPTDRRAETVMLSGGVHRVVEHAPDRVVAVPVDGGRALAVAQDETVVLELNPRRFADAICSALGFEQASGQLQPEGMFANLARHRATRATLCPVHACMHCDPGALRAATRRLLVEGDGPMIILTPTGFDDPDIDQIVRLRGACHLSLRDAIELDGAQKPTSTEIARRRLSEFTGTVETWEAGPSVIEPYRFARSGRVWVLTFNRSRCYMPHKDAGGLAYIQHLLARPGQEIPVERLEEMVTGNLALDAVSTGEAVVDRATLEDIWREMQRLRGQIDAAGRMGDIATKSRLEAELEPLADQVRSVHGLNDRVRRVGDQTEQLRSKVTNSIRRAIKALDELPAMAAHLIAIKPGKTLSYRPDSHISWDFSDS